MPSERPYTIEQTTNRKNLLQLIYLRGVAICGQLLTILFVHYGMGITLPISEMLLVIEALVILNVLSWHFYRAHERIGATSLFFELLMDAAALTVQLYLSGGATNPFVSLFLLQVIIGALLLRPAYAWALGGVTLGCYVLLTRFARDLPLPSGGLDDLFSLHIQGALISYALAASLSVWFLTRINANLKERDARFAVLKQQSLEEEHIMRMGLLTAGAAHELGTPLATLSVILRDWQSLSIPDSAEQREQDIQTMQAEVQRCKDIVTAILQSSGQVRGEGGAVTTLRAFVDEVVSEWRASRSPSRLEYVCRIAQDHRIVYDRVIQQILFNIFDNALESSSDWVGIEVGMDEGSLVITVRDRGKGFSPQVLEDFGKPYVSTKHGFGRGLGIFLVVNTLRKLGGMAEARNREEGGASVTLTIPLHAISLEEDSHAR